MSIIDKEAVLVKARELQIDGIMSFACDPGVVSASYVQEQMGLPSFGPFKSVEILQNKDNFRAFLTENGFNVPWAFGFASKEDARDSRDKFNYPLIVKPTDSAGSKGCTLVDDEEHLMAAIEYAFKYTISGHIIIEEFLEKRGCSSDTYSYSYNGKQKFVSFCAQRFDANATNPYTPAAYSWPSTFTKEEEYLTSEIQRLITLLGMKTSVWNIETRVSTNNKPIDKLEGWTRKEDEICNNNGKYFRIIGVKVSISNREVTSWCQPLVQPLQQGLCVFIIRKIGGIYHFLVQAKLECGNYDVMELAPTVQCLTGNVYEATKKPPFADYVLAAPKEQIRYDVFQSEEGGRFFHEQNRNMIVEVGKGFSLELPEHYIWMTLNQINHFLKFNNYLNIQARSILSAIKYSK